MPCTAKTADATLPTPNTHEPTPNDSSTLRSRNSPATPNMQTPTLQATLASLAWQGRFVSRGAGPGNDQPCMVFTGTLSNITNNPELLAEWETELVGTGIVPTAVASYYRCISEFAGQLLNAHGEVLWHGRSKRRATPGQWVALVVRDRGCIRCNTDAHRCEAHHLVPFSAPAKGETNIR